MRSEPAATRDRLLQSGALLMAEKGFDGVTVRAICQHAETSSNMIHHYFGSKRGLLDAIVESYSLKVLEVPMWLLETPPTSREEFVSRFGLLFAATLDAYLANRPLMMVVVREQATPPALGTYTAKLTRFLEEAKACGFVRAELDVEMVTGAMLDRIINQVQFAPWMERELGVDLHNDRAYRERWTRANVDLFVHGMVA